MKLLGHFFILELKKILTFRAEFWIGFLGSIATQFAVAFFLWLAIFTSLGVERLEGYTFTALMLYYLMVPLVERTVMGPEMGFLSAEIYEGTLTRYLVYPMPLFRYKYVAHLATSSVFAVQLLSVLGIFLLLFGMPAGANVSFTSILMAFTAMGFASLLYFALAGILEMVAFWADNVWSLLILNRMVTSLLGGGLIPLTFFPEWSRVALEFLPFSKLLYFPLQCLLGQVSFSEWIFGLFVTSLWIVLLGIGAAWIWRRGSRQYAGVGI